MQTAEVAEVVTSDSSKLVETGNSTSSKLQIMQDVASASTTQQDSMNQIETPSKQLVVAAKTKDSKQVSKSIMSDKSMESIKAKVEKHITKLPKRDGKDDKTNHQISSGSSAESEQNEHNMNEQTGTRNQRQRAGGSGLEVWSGGGFEMRSGALGPD